ncbi:MAG: outer membrane lipoprotein-sorting protein [Bacteroidetes bacterium HGW-Bacteroidetes-6]|nr:MAG: outer membrane lipoprotein-sorting protein [Bacteroidetes bacterium HGW-Bacteroidetes-6]
MKRIFLWAITSVIFSCSTNAQTATEIVTRAYNKMQGNSAEMTITMKLVRPTWERTISIKSWNKGSDYSMVLITAPVKDQGQTFLKRQNDMWNWVPSISRMIKLPSSMMSQSWMGSDLSYDDFMKESSIVNDYTHKIVGSETIGGYDCYKIELTPKPNAAVVWGKVIKWISKNDYYILKSEYYDEDIDLVRTENVSQIKSMNDRSIPTYYEVIPADKPGNKTIMIIELAKFNITIDDSFFSQQNMKTVK